jgi:uncharacterized iron-regulated membrane protein
MRRFAVSPGVVRAVLDGHSVLGLAFGALLYLVCVSGTLAVFADLIEAWEQPTASAIRTIEPDRVDGALAQALAEAGGSAETAALYAVLPSPDLPRLTVTAFGPGQDRRWTLDGAGSLGERPARWAAFVTDLHSELTLPAPWGGSLVGLAGVALLALILTGVLAHPRIFKDAFAFRPFRSRRLRETDLHNRLAVWGLPFHLTISLTGAFFGLSTLVLMGISTIAYHGDTGRALSALTGPALADDPAPAPLPPLGAMLAQLGPNVGDPTFVYVERPGTRGQKITIELPVRRRLAQGERYYFDGAGTLLGAGGFVAGSAGRQLYAAAAALHFGTYGGLPVRIAYGLLGMALSAIAAGGITIWLVRWRDRGRPAPRLERAWLGIVWGMPLALALSATGAVTASDSPAPLFWSLLALAVAAALAHRNPEPLSRRLRLGLAMALAAAVIAEALRFGGLAWTGSAGLVNLGLLALPPAVGLAPAITLARRDSREADRISTSPDRRSRPGGAEL